MDLDVEVMQAVHLPAAVAFAGNCQRLNELLYVPGQTRRVNGVDDLPRDGQKRRNLATFADYPHFELPDNFE